MPKCPQEKKRKFHNREKALLAAAEGGKPDLGAYLCVCGWWHLTKKNSNGRASEEIIHVLLAASDDEFFGLVRAELAGRATPDEVAALRSDELLPRWKRAIDALLAESQQKLSAVLEQDDPFSKEWRKRRQRWVEQAAARRKEITPLLGSLHMRRESERRAAREARARRSPRNRAIDRLIEAHQDEFELLLKEEEGRR